MTLNRDPFFEPGSIIDPKRNSYYGATCGRVAGRIRDAQFSLPNGKVYNLTKNNGNNNYNGGTRNFSRVCASLIYSFLKIDI